MSKENQSAAKAEQAVVDLSDPKVLMGILANMFQQQAESTSINKRLLEIKEREEEARLKKDADALAKWTREREAALSELKLMGQHKEKRWKNCPHSYRGGSTIWPISGYPHGQLVGLCSQCFMPIEPEHYEYDAAGKATLVPEHPMYAHVRERDTQIYQPFMPVMGY